MTRIQSESKSRHVNLLHQVDSYTIVFFFILKIIVVFRTDLHKMKIKHRIIGEYATKRCFFDLKKLIIVTGRITILVDNMPLRYGVFV
jgi:hypothetical protein